MKKLRLLADISESINDSIIAELLDSDGDSLPETNDFIGRFVKIKPLSQSASVQDVDLLINSITGIEKQKSGDNFAIKVNGRVNSLNFDVDKPTLIKFLNGKPVTAGNYSLTLN